MFFSEKVFHYYIAEVFGFEPAITPTSLLLGVHTKNCSQSLYTIYTALQSSIEIIETTAKNGVVPVAISNLKLFLRTTW